LKQARLLIGLVSLIMFLSGNWGAWANTPGNLDDPETVIRMIVKANAEMDLKTLETHMAAEEDTLGYTSGGRKYIGWRDVKQAFEKEFPMPSGITLIFPHVLRWAPIK